MEDDALHGLVNSWLAGFCLSRGAPSRRVGRLVEIAVGTGTQRTERVLVEPDPAALGFEAARLVGDAGTWLSVIGRTRRDLAPPSGVVEVMHDETLMTVQLRRSAQPGDVAMLYEPGRDRDRLTVRVVVADVQVAQGTIGVTGARATFDRVGTENAFRRRGYGRVVMDALSAWALDRGATHGVLAASVEGRALYESLGWGVVAQLQTLRAASAGATGS